MMRNQKVDVLEGIDVNKTCASKECEFIIIGFSKIVI